MVPTVTIQIPLYNERTAAEQIVRAAAAQDYPRGRYDIQVLDDSTDETSDIVAAVIAELRGTGVPIEHIRRTDRVGYKAGALSAGLLRSDADFVALFDADFVPEENFLSRLILDAGAFDDPKVAFVQARWAWGGRIEGLLPSALALLLDRHFAIQKPTRAFVGNVTTFNGSAGIWRRNAIDEAGGWTSDTLTEDLDLSYRCALKGWKGRYLRDVLVSNELPGHMRAFKLQQRRWAKGNAQCFRKLTRRVVASRGVVLDRLDEAFMLAGYAIHPLLLMSLVLWPWAVLYVDRTLFWILQGLMSLGMIAALLSFLLTIRERDGGISFRAVGELLFGMGVGMGLMVNNTVGQIQGFLRSGGEFVRTPKGSGGPAGRGRRVGRSGAGGAVREGRSGSGGAVREGRSDDGADLVAVGAGAGGGAAASRAGGTVGAGTTVGAGSTGGPARPGVARSTGGAAGSGVPGAGMSARSFGLTAPRPKGYASPLDWTFFAEILVMGYCVAGAAFLIQAGEGLWSLPMMMWALCMGLMVQQQMLAPRTA